MKQTSQTDTELVIAYQSGRQEVITELVKRWHLTFCQKANWVVKDVDLSKDIAQESWQIIMNKLNRLDNPSRFKSWALRIVYNKSIDALRLKNNNRLKQNEYKKTQNIADEEINDQSELKIKLLNAINQLPEHHQLVLRLFYTQEYSLKEISEILNVSVGTVKSRLFHSREKLKSILNKN